MDKLRSCPFCSGEGHDCKDGTVYCIKCECVMNSREAWNTRALKVDEGEIKKVVFSAMYYGEYDENDEIKMADVEPVSDAIVKYLEGKKALEPLPSAKKEKL